MPLRKILLLLIAATCLSTAAQTIGEEEALRRAQAFMRQAMPAMRSHTDGHMVLKQKLPAAYVFATDGGQFVLAATDYRLPPILGYGNHAGPAIPPALADLMQLHALSLTGPAAASAYTTTPVPPLLDGWTRHQEDPYNRLCPHYTNADGTTSDNPCVVGCVATAMESVVSYYRRELTLVDTLFGWQTDHYTVPDVLPGQSVNTNLILPRYDEGTYTDAQADAVARLSLWLGMAARMNWGLEASGANVYRLEEPLRRAFGFGYVHHMDSYYYTPETWRAMLENELRAGRPVMYAGSVMKLGGHAFVIDGVDEGGRFHADWGLDGYYDGYFHLDLLNPAEPLYDLTEQGALIGCFCNQEAIFFHPDPVSEPLPAPLERTGREVVVESVELTEPPMSGKYTPLTVRLRNTSSQPLTTPFLIFTNAPTDTLVFEQGVSAGIFGLSLRPGEERTMQVHCVLGTSGRQRLRLTPDAENVVYDTEIDIAPYVSDDMRFGTPQLTFPEPGVVHIATSVSNLGEGRSGYRVTYCLNEGDTPLDNGSTQHARFLYLKPGETVSDTVSFRGLVPGTTYALMLRWPWTPVDTLVFRMPDASAIAPMPVAGTQKREAWHTLSGQRALGKEKGQVYIRRGRKQISK